MEADIDRLVSFIVFDREFGEDIFITYPIRIPEDFKSALLARIREVTRHYWRYHQTRKGYHKILKGLFFLEAVARHRFEGCLLVEDKNKGFQLELKPEYKKEKK